MGLWLAKHVITPNPLEDKKPIHIFYKNVLYIMKARNKPMPIGQVVLEYRAAENILRCTYLSNVSVVFTLTSNILSIDVYKTDNQKKQRHVKEYPWSFSMMHIELNDMDDTEMRNPASALILSKFNLR